MKLIKFRTKITNDELISKFETIPMMELEFILSLSKYFEYIDINCNQNRGGLFGIMADSYKERLENFFQKYSIPYSVKDMTKDVFFDNSINVSYTDNSGVDISNKIKEFIFNFKTNYITQDDVLDKILEKGIESLTDFDRQILK